MDVEIERMPASLGENPLDDQSASAPNLQHNKSLTRRGPRPGTITYPSSCGHGVESVPGIALRKIEESCPLLAAAFEPTRAGPRLHLENLNSDTARPFVRFLQSGSYSITEDGDIYADVPSSLLLHLQLYHLASIYDLPTLQDQANVNVIRQCEFGCSSPDRPIDLIEGIRYAYKHLPGETALANTIVSYCVSHLSMLEDTADFRQLVKDLLPFSQDICKENMRRGFEDESKRDALEACASRMASSPQRTHEEMFNFHGSEEVDLPATPKKRKHFHLLRTAAMSRNSALTYNEKQEDYDERKVLKVMNLSFQDEANAKASDDLEDVLRKMREQHSSVGKTYIRDERQSTTPEPKPSEIADDVDYADDALADWVADTYAARTPEVRAAETYNNASSGPLFHFDEIDSTHHPAYENLTKQEIMYNFEDRHVRFDPLRGPLDWDFSAEQRIVGLDQQDGRIDSRDRTLKTATQMRDNLEDQKLAYDPEEDDFLLMRPTRRASSRAISDAVDSPSGVEEHYQGSATHAVRASSNLADTSIVRDDVGSDSGSDTFEHIEHPNRSTLPCRQRDVESHAVPVHQPADGVSGFSDSEWSIV